MCIRDSYWGMGISQSTHGTDNALALANLALMCGHLGAEGAGLNPLRGQNNVQGCSDAGGLFNVFPGYQRVDDPAIRAKFAWAWGAPLNPQPGLATPEMVDGAGSGALRAFYVMGENPLMSEPCLLYTSDAADERSSVDLGGRRIIKKKNNDDTVRGNHTTTHDKKNT